MRWQANCFATARQIHAWLHVWEVERRNWRASAWRRVSRSFSTALQGLMHDCMYWKPQTCWDVWCTVVPILAKRSKNRQQSALHHGTAELLGVPCLRGCLVDSGCTCDTQQRLPSALYRRCEYARCLMLTPTRSAAGTFTTSLLQLQLRLMTARIAKAWISRPPAKAIHYCICSAMCGERAHKSTCGMAPH